MPKGPDKQAKETKHLFILGMNDSGTTFLQNQLSECRNVVSFSCPSHPHGLEGQAAAWYYGGRTGRHHIRDVDHQITKMWTEKAGIFQDPKHYNWMQIKKAWGAAWGCNAHNKTANPRILLQKTPWHILIPEMLIAQFPNVQFMMIHRDPYAICEGIRRTTQRYKKLGYTLERCANHWVECSKIQKQNIEKYVKNGRAIFIPYELMTEEPAEAEKKIKEFMAGLDDINFKKKVMCHSMDQPQKRHSINYNLRHWKNLSQQDLDLINLVLEKNMNIMEYFGYPILKSKIEIENMNQ